MNDRIEIPISKKKMVLFVFGSIIFVVSGIFMYFNADSSEIDPNSIFYKTVAIIAVLFFGATGVAAIRRLLHPKIGLIIDSKGITDNSTVTSIGFIPWKDIKGMQPIKISSNNFLVIHVKNPDVYINKAGNILSKQGLKFNNNSYGSPIAINGTTLALKFTEVEKLAYEALDTYTL